MHKTTIFLFTAYLFMVSSASGDGEPVVFSENTFNNSDWDLTVRTFFGGGATSATQVNTGGNPGAYRRVTTVVNTGTANPGGVFGFHRRIGAVYDPGTQGAIASVDYSEDARMFSGGGLGQATGPAIRQNGTIYLVRGLHSPDFAWVYKELNDLQQDDFDELLTTGMNQGGGLVLTDDTRHPDFSVEGALIEIGFYRFNSTCANAPYSIVGGIDNWQFAITPVTECLKGDVNMDGEVNQLDVDPFVTSLLKGACLCEADINQDGAVNLLDVEPFVDLLTGG